MQLKSLLNLSSACLRSHFLIKEDSPSLLMLIWLSVHDSMDNLCYICKISVPLIWNDVQMSSKWPSVCHIMTWLKYKICNTLLLYILIAHLKILFTAIWGLCMHAHQAHTLINLSICHFYFILHVHAYSSVFFNNRVDYLPIFHFKILV